MNETSDLARIWKEAVKSYFKALFQYLFGWTVVDYKNTSAILAAFWDEILTRNPMRMMYECFVYHRKVISGEPRKSQQNSNSTAGFEN
jgi:hypothetical protein